MTTRVVTWETSRHEKKSICRKCEREMTRRHDWPRSPSSGEEYAQVYRGEHWGRCAICGR